MAVTFVPGVVTNGPRRVRSGSGLGPPRRTDDLSAVFPRQVDWAIQVPSARTRSKRGAEPCRPVTTSVRPTVRTAAPRSSRATRKEAVALCPSTPPRPSPPNPGPPRSPGTTRTSSSTTSASAPGIPATDPDELRYTLESRLHVLPSFATVAGAGMGVVGGLSAPGDRRRPRRRPARRPVASRCTGRSRSTGDATADLAGRRGVRQGQGRRPRPAHRGRRRRTARCGPATPQIFVRGEGGLGGERGPSDAARAPRPRARPARWSGPSARTRRCSTGSPATGTRCTPTPSSPSSPASTGRSCTGCARTA